MELILPGALWPNANASGFAPCEHYPRLARWLGQSRVKPLAQSYQEILVYRFGLPSQPAAWLRWLGEEDSAKENISLSEGALLCADPIHLYLAREQLVVTELGQSAATAIEAQQLTAALTESVRLFWPSARFVAATPSRWYLLGIPYQEIREVAFVPLAQASSRSWRESLPQGRQARSWLHLMNEWQVILANHPVNAEREARGLPPINGIWLWGEATVAAAAACGSCAGPPAPLSTGKKGDDHRPGCTVVAASSDPLLIGWLRVQHVPLLSANTLPQPLPANALILLDLLAEPARRLDLAAWQAALAALEHDWFARFPATPRTIWLAGHRAALVATPRWWLAWRPPRTLESLLTHS